MDASGTKRAAYGELTHGQKLVETISSDAPVTAASDWQIAGKSLPKVDGRAFVTGEHQYTSDLVRPGMQFGKVLRPAAFDGKLATFDAGAAESSAV